MQIGVLTAKLTLDSADFVSGTEDAKKSAKGLGEAISGLNFRQIGAEIAGVGAVLTGVFGTGLALAVKAASDLNESLTKSQVVFGESAKAIADWSKTAATSLGLSTQAALESAATFGNLFSAMGMTQPAAAEMSQNLVQLAADLASFNNQSPEEMLLKLRSGLVGEVEPLRSVGVQMNEATVQAKAMALGLGQTKEQISEADKVLARYAIILDQTKNAQGDFGRTSDGVANQMRIMKARTDDLLASFGESLLPAVSGGLKIFNGLLAILTALPPELKNVAVAVVAVTAAVGASMVVIGGLVALLGGPLTLTIVAVVGTMAALTAAIALEWDRILAIFQGGTVNVRITMKQLAGILGATADAFAILARLAVMQFDIIVTGAREMVIGVSGAFTALKVGLAGTLGALASGNIKDFAVALLNVGTVTKETFGKMGLESLKLRTRIGADVTEIKNHFTGTFKGAFEKAADGVTTSVGKIGTDLKHLTDGLSNAGKAAGASGKAQADAAEKAAKAWHDWAEKVLAAFDKVAAAALKLDLSSRKDFEDMALSSESWLNTVQKHVSMFDLEMSAAGQAVKKLQTDWSDATKILEEAEGRFTDKLIAGIRERGAALREQANAVRQMQQDWGDGLGSMIDAVGQMTGKTSMQVNAWSHDIAGIIRTMPGKFGDAARGILRTVDMWIQFANSILAVLHRLNEKIPAALDQIGKSMDSVSKASTDASQDWSASMGSMTTDSEEGSGKIQKAFALATASVGAFITGMQVSAATGHKAIGSLVGGIQGALSGFAVAGPVGAVVGGVAGVLGGLFGHGKSAEQKAEEERQKKQMAMDMEKTAIDITSAALDSMKKALEMFKALADHVDVPRAAIKSFFATLEKVTKEFLSLAGKFAKENMEAAKVFAESMGPIVELMGGALQAFEGLHFYTAIPAKAIEALAADIGRAAELMGGLAADIEANVVKKAMKFSKQMQFVVELIGGSIEAFVKLQTYEGVPAYIMGWLMQDIQTATDMMGEIADNTSRNMLNKAKTYAERISVIVQSIGAAVTALTSLKTYEAVPQAAFDALQHDVITALSMIDNLVGAAEMYLDRALTFEELVKRIVGALDSGVSLIRSVGGSALSPGGIGLPDGSLRLGGGASSTSSSSVDQSVHIGAVTLSPGQSGYREARQWADVQRIQRAR